jgi:RyR domain-containing protein
MGIEKMNIEIIARVCHEANRAFAVATGESLETLHPSWDDAPGEIRESSRIGVQTALNGATPEKLHESWMSSKYAAGWVYGPVRNNTAKIHPCLVPYDDLPEVQRRKDALFSAIVNALK